MGIRDAERFTEIKTSPCHTNAPNAGDKKSLETSVAKPAEDLDLD